jgi:hypothetical protein
MVTFAVAAGILAATAFGLASRPARQPKIRGYLRPEDPAQIQRAVRRDRWQITRACAGKREFKLLFGLCLPDMALGRIIEIGSLPDRSIHGFGLSITNPSSRAYALSGGWYSRKSVQYGLNHTTNGWEVLSFGYH